MGEGVQRTEVKGWKEKEGALSWRIPPGVLLKCSQNPGYKSRDARFSQPNLEGSTE